MQKEQDGSILLESFREVYTAEVALRKGGVSDEAPLTFEAAEASASCWQDPDNPPFYQVRIPASEVGVVIGALRDRSEKRLSLITAKAARRIVQAYDTNSEQDTPPSPHLRLVED